MEDKIISVLNNVRTNLSNELETKRKELVKPFDDFADRLSAIEVDPLKIRGLSIEEIDNNFENISVEILEKLEMYKELSKLSFYKFLYTFLYSSIKRYLWNPTSSISNLFSI